MSGLYRRAIRERRRTTASLMVGLVALTAWITALFPVIRGSDAFTNFLEDFPPQTAALLGIDAETYLTGAGYLGAQIYSLLGPLMMIAFVVCGAIQATAGEETDGTMDTLLSAPVSRRRVLLERAFATLTLSLSVAAALAIALLIANPIFELRLSVAGIVAANLSLWLLGIVYGAVALVAGAFTGRPTLSRGITFGLALVAWIVTGFAPLYTWLDAPSTISPLTWYRAEVVLLEPWRFGQLWLIVASIALTLFAVRLFEMRDIATEQVVLPEVASSRFRRSKQHNPRAAWLLENVFRKTIWDRRRSVWAWIAGIAALLLVTFVAWPTISRDAVAMEELINALPPEVFALFGVSDPSTMTTSAGFISSRAYQSVGPIIIVVFAVGAVTSLVSKEETTGSLDMVLSNPVLRRQVLRDKAAAIGGLLALIALALSVITLIGNVIWDTDLQAIRIVGANVGLALLGLAFGGIALALWSVLGSAAAVTRITTATITIAWFMNGLGSIVDVLEPLRRLSPFYWYLGDAAPLAKGFEPAYLLLLAVGLLGAFVAVRRFDHRDLGL